MKNNYIDNRELLAHIRESRAQSMLTDGAVKCLELMINRIARPLVYKSSEFKKDILAHALMIVVERWAFFDEVKSPNAFAYYTRVIKNALAASFKKYSNKKGTIHISIEALLNNENTG